MTSNESNGLERPYVDDPFSLRGKIAVVTGGSRGLGLQMVRAFARAGADVVIASRKIDACEAAAAEVRQMGRRALAISANASVWDEMSRLADAAYDAFGRIDILVNNAGMSPAIPSHEITESMFDKIVSLNFKGPFRLASLVAARMRAGEGGAIINTSSTAAFAAMPNVVAYGAAKAALNSMTISLAREYGPKVRVNAISAGPFLTDISKAWRPEDREVAPNSLGRPGRPEEIVTTALYLASPASSFVTGAIVRCDGGLN
jgi:NAD(P)-dependent dehydrogenase (short-subunit alcohol dehydrogenase family)